MRWIGAAVLSLGVASAASAQLAWLGGSWGGAWEWHAPSAPDQDFLHSSEGVPTLFVALPLSDDTLWRFSAAELPHTAVVDGAAWPGKFRAYTTGIDYFLGGSFGQSIFSAGLGSYNYRLQAKQPPPDIEGSKFGWYFGLGEWIGLTRRTRITIDVTAHHTEHSDHPTILTANLGFAVGW